MFQYFLFFYFRAFYHFKKKNVNDKFSNFKIIKVKNWIIFTIIPEKDLEV